MQNKPIPQNIQNPLHNYRDIFAAPTQLPSNRIQDHHIPLKPNSNPVNAHPYRCLTAHKEEIEKIIREMLTTGVIRANMSPFASLVLLVRKKDNTWRLVALNEITIKNKYHTLVIEEFLVELKGSTIYAKLDFRISYHQI